jgi:predicted small lipoprotein YifL
MFVVGLHRSIAMRRFSLIALLVVGLAGCAQLAPPELPPPPAGFL